MKTRGKTHDERSLRLRRASARQGGNLAVLERLDAALAKNTRPQLSDREKLDRLRRALFGDERVDAANASEARARAERDEPAN
jgi:hypothetical protein